MHVYVELVYFIITNLNLNNAAGHGKQAAQFSNVRVEYLPPNTTSQMQPMDQGIINVGKGNYKKRLVKKMLDGLDESDKIIYPNVKEALYMLVGAWNDVSKSTIVNCWNHANIIEEKDKEEIINKINSENEKHTLIHNVREFLSQFEKKFKRQC